MIVDPIYALITIFIGTFVTAGSLQRGPVLLMRAMLIYWLALGLVNAALLPAMFAHGWQHAAVAAFGMLLGGGVLVAERVPGWVMKRRTRTALALLRGYDDGQTGNREGQAQRLVSRGT